MLADVVSSTGPLRQMMRSFSSREKMSSGHMSALLVSRHGLELDVYRCASHLPRQSACDSARTLTSVDVQWFPSRKVWVTILAQASYHAWVTAVVPLTAQNRCSCSIFG